MTQKEMLLYEEAHYPSDTFADCVKGDGFTAFYFDENKDYRDGNHAIIYPEQITDLCGVLDEVREFYAQRNSEAAIYHPLADEYYHCFEENRELIEQCGYEITLFDDSQFMILTGENTIKRKNQLDIRLLGGWDDRIASDIILPCEVPWEIEQTKKFASRKDNYIFAGFIDDNAVIYATLHKSRNYDCVRFDYILCAKQHRGKGYGGELMSYIADYCTENMLKGCFLVPESPYSEKIARKVGFTNAFTARAGVINTKPK